MHLKLLFHTCKGSYILELFNSQISFMLFIVIYVMDELVGFYYLSAVKLHLMVIQWSVRLGSYSLRHMDSFFIF